jgi:ribonuclease J
VTIFKACRRAGRQFIMDLYTAESLRATGNERLPQASWDTVRVFLPASQKWRIKSEKAFDVPKPYYPYRIYPEELPGAVHESVMLFRPSMVRDVEEAGCLKDGCVVCSVWPGYTADEGGRLGLRDAARNARLGHLARRTVQADRPQRFLDRHFAVEDLPEEFGRLFLHFFQRAG